MAWLSVANFIVLVLAFGIPAAILVGRFAVKRQRQHVLLALQKTMEEATGTNVAMIPSFEFALQKYDIGHAGAEPSARSRDTGPDPRTARRLPWWMAWMFAEWTYYTITGVAFAFISAAGFSFVFHLGDDAAFWSTPNLLFAGPDMIAPPAPANGATGVDPQLLVANYQKTTGSFIALAFLGAYIWSLLYLIRRISNYDLSPMSFLRCAGQIVLACSMALVVRHVLPENEVEGLIGAAIILGAFLVGFYPTFGIDYLLQKFPNLQLKRVDIDAPAVYRSMPLDMIDGISSFISFRLGEREVEDVQNLATENPVLLCAETPYGIFEVIDWIAQAQLALAVGPKKYKSLRDIGVRNIYSLQAAAGQQHLGKAAAKILYEGQPEDGGLQERVKVMMADLHVVRMTEVWCIVQEVLLAQRQKKPAADQAPPEEHVGEDDRGTVVQAF